jgi:threonine synthase
MTGPGTKADGSQYSYLTYLKCSACQTVFDPQRIQTFCPDCQAPLVAYYDLEKARAEVDRDYISHQHGGMWRWHAVLPVQNPEHVITLGEGDTPLLHLPRLGAQKGFSNLLIKDESLNPTGSFKARGLAAAISRAHELGVEKVVIPTAGNAGGAMAAYASRGGMQSYIFMPRDTPVANIKESRIAGATVILIQGLISEAAGMAGEKARNEGWFDVSTFKEPYRAEGKKVMGYEIAEAMNWTLPDVILYPTGGGTGLVGIWKAIQEMAAMGWLETKSYPRMVAVQAEGCAPVVRAVDNNMPFCDFFVGAKTHASGLRVPKSFADQLILQTIKESHGTAVGVTEEAITAAQLELASVEGLFVAPEGAATLAGLEILKQRGWVSADERILLLNTGTGLKYLEQLPD